MLPKPKKTKVKKKPEVEANQVFASKTLKYFNEIERVGGNVDTRNIELQTILEILESSKTSSHDKSIESFVNLAMLSLLEINNKEFIKNQMFQKLLDTVGVYDYSIASIKRRVAYFQDSYPDLFEAKHGYGIKLKKGDHTQLATDVFYNLCKTYISKNVVIYNKKTDINKTLIENALMVRKNPFQSLLSLYLSTMFHTAITFNYTPQTKTTMKKYKDSPNVSYYKVSNQPYIKKTVIPFCIVFDRYSILLLANSLEDKTKTENYRLYSFNGISGIKVKGSAALHKNYIPQEFMRNYDDTYYNMLGKTYNPVSKMKKMFEEMKKIEVEYVLVSGKKIKESFLSEEQKARFEQEHQFQIKK